MDTSGHHLRIGDFGAAARMRTSSTIQGAYKNNVQDFLGGGSKKAAQANAALATELDKTNLAIAKATTPQS